LILPRRLGASEQFGVDDGGVSAGIVQLPVDDFTEVMRFFNRWKKAPQLKASRPLARPTRVWDPTRWKSTKMRGRLRDCLRSRRAPSWRP
jgi:hypothetical protein